MIDSCTHFNLSSSFSSRVHCLPFFLNHSYIIVKVIFKVEVASWNFILSVFPIFSTFVFYHY